MQQDAIPMTLDFDSLPVDLHRYILGSMDPEDILVVRKAKHNPPTALELAADLDHLQTCKHLLALTRERSLWTAVYSRMLKTHVLGCSESEFEAMSTLQLERLLVRTSRTEKQFPAFRGHIERRIFPSGQTRQIGPLAELCYLSERYILSVNNATVVYVWDTTKLFATVSFSPCARLGLIGRHAVTYGMTTDRSLLCVVLSKGTRAHVFSLNLTSGGSDADSNSELSFSRVARFDTDSRPLWSIDADSCLALLADGDNIIEVVDWRTQRRATVSLLSEGEAAGVPPENYMLALRVCGPYILCFNNWTIDAYPIPLQVLKPELRNEQHRHLPVLQHTLDGLEFPSTTSFSISRAYCDRSSSGDIYSTYVLTRDARRIVLHYQVLVRTTPVSSLSVRPLGSNGGHNSSQISAWGLATSGLRGAYAVSVNFGAINFVFAFTARLPRNSSEQQSSGETVALNAAITPHLDGQLVSVVLSSNTSDEVLLCVVSEFTGQIALGWRSGAITLL